LNKKSAFIVLVQLPRKNGFVKGIQRYKCAVCKKQFIGDKRISEVTFWEEYSVGKQTYTQLAIKYDCSIKTIQRKLDLVSINNHNKTQ